MEHLHRSILQRIFWAWLLISVGSLVFISVIGIRRFDSLTTRMAVTEADRVLHSGLNYADSPESIGRPPVGVQEQLPPELYSLGFYDSQGALAARMDGPALRRTGPIVGSGLKDLPRDGRIHLNHFDRGQETILQWMVPVRDAPGARVGFIEGVMFLSEHDVWMLATSIKVVALAVMMSISITALALYPLMLSLNRRLFQFSTEVAGGQIEILSVLSAAIAQRDSDTSEHNFRVTLYAIRLAEALGTGGMDMRALILGSLLHDVGKIGVRDDILLKPGPLTDQEVSIMRSHVQKGLEIVSFSHWLRPAMDVIEYHHEHCDGSGYPQGAAGEAIPHSARLFAIVDVFDALTSPRPYKLAWPVERALEYIKDRADEQFDSAILRTFQSIACAIYAEAYGRSSDELLSLLLRATQPYREISPKDQSS